MAKDSIYWSDAEKGQVHGPLWEYAGHLEKQHTSRIALDKACLRLVAPMPDLTAKQLTRNGSFQSISTYETFRRQGPNISKEVVGGALAMLVRPLQVKVMPVGAEFQIREFCHQASKLVDGVMAAERWPETFQRVAEDSMHMTFGAAKTFVDSRSEIRLERVDTLGLFWDMYESEPLTLLQVHAVPKRRLMAMYPQHAAKIKELETWYPDPIPGVENVSRLWGKPDTVKVVEATAVKIGDQVGRHAIIVQGIDLEDDDFEDEQHDISVLRWENDPRSWGGISLVRGTAPYHALIAKYQRMRTEQLKGCVPIIWKHIDEEVFKNISDLEYQIATYSSAQPPKLEIAGKVSGDIEKEIETLRNRCYAENGVSFEIATSTKPFNDANAAATREWADTQSLRQIQRQYRVEQHWRDIANKICRKAAVAYKKKGAVIRAPGTDFLAEIKWPDLKENQYQAVASVASGLSLTVSGKLDQLEKLSNLGVLDPADVGVHLRLPDTEEEQELRSAPSDLARKQIQECLAGRPMMPSPSQDHGRALKLAQLEYQLAMKKESFGPGGQIALRRYIRRLEAFLAPPPAAPVPAPAAAPAPPPGGQPAPAPAPQPSAPPAA